MSASKTRLEGRFKDWYKRANTAIPHLESWQEGRLRQQLKKAYQAGRKQGRAERAIALREMLRQPSNAKPTGQRR